MRIHSVQGSVRLTTDNCNRRQVVISMPPRICW